MEIIPFEYENKQVIRAWIENGSPPLDDLGPVIGVYGANLVKIFAGKAEPDNKTKELLSKVLNKKVEELFPEREEK